MQEASLEEIKAKALSYHEHGQKWHFHILSPGCTFNPGKRYAFILEGPEEERVLIYFSDQAEKALGQELSPLVHGSKIMHQETTDADYRPSETIQKMAQRAKELNDRGIEWHHHVLYSDCHFNSHTPQFVLTLEDSSTGEMFESFSDTEPTNDLKQIESLFYAQTKAS